MADEPTTDTYTDDALSALVDTKGSPEAAAAAIWQTKAGQLAKLVNTSESGSSRSNGDLYKNAVAMAKYYDGLATPVEVVDTSSPMTVDIERV